MSHMDWRITILNPKDKTITEDFRAAYEMWKKSWWDVFEQIEKPYLMHSDQFMRQDSILALFCNNKCAGLSFFSEADMNERFWNEDSYFSVWPQLAIKKLTAQGNRVLVCSYFTVSHEFRKTHTNISTKDVLLGLLVRYFMTTSSDVMTGSLRNSKGINSLCYRWGALPLMQEVKFNHESNDLVGFFRSSIKDADDTQLVELVNRIWDLSNLSNKKFKLAA